MKHIILAVIISLAMCSVASADFQGWQFNFSWYPIKSVQAVVVPQWSEVFFNEYIINLY